MSVQRTYNPSVRVGNWNEDLCLEEVRSTLDSGVAKSFIHGGRFFMAAEVAGATNPHNVFLAHAHRRLSLILLTADSSAFTALCTRKSGGAAKSEQGGR